MVMFLAAQVTFSINVGLHDIVRLMLILYCFASICKTMLDAILIYSFQYNIKIVVWC